MGELVERIVCNCGSETIPSSAQIRRLIPKWKQVESNLESNLDGNRMKMILYYYKQWRVYNVPGYLINKECKGLSCVFNRTKNKLSNRALFWVEFGRPMPHYCLYVVLSSCRQIIFLLSF